MSVNWDNYKEFDRIVDMYLPPKGQGDTKATQLVTAVNKLVYKWYNDGDVYDNTGYLDGWANDLSSYANWIYKYIPGLGQILDGVFECTTDSDYEDLLWDLTTVAFDLEDLEKLDKQPAVGDIYRCDGPFEFREYSDDDDDEEW